MAVTASLSAWESSYSIANNTSYVGCKLSVTVSGAAYNNYGMQFTIKIAGSSSGAHTIAVPLNSTKSYSWYTTVAHNANGTGSAACSGTIVTGIDPPTLSKSKTITLTTIPRKSGLTVADGVLGTEQTLTIDRKASSFTHVLTYTCGTATGTIPVNETTCMASFTPPESLASQNTTGTSVSITYTLTTYNGSTSLGSNSYTKTCTMPTGIKPSCVLTLSDPTGYLAAYGGYIKDKSKIRVQTVSTLAYNSPVSIYNIAANGATYIANDITTAVVNTVGSNTVTANVTDSRGRVSDTVSESITVLDYSNPTILSFSLHRCVSATNGEEDMQGGYCQVLFDATATSLSNQNNVAYTLEYKQNGETEYTSIPLTGYSNNYNIQNGAYIFAANSSYSYIVRLTATDNFGSTTKVTTLSTGYAIMHWGNDGTSLAIGKIAEVPNLFDVGMNARFGGSAEFNGSNVFDGDSTFNAATDFNGNNVFDGNATFNGDTYGSVLSLGRTNIVPSGSNLDNCKTPGVYAVTSNSTAGTITNIPTASAGKLVVEYSLGSYSDSGYAYITQTYTPFLPGKPIYKRSLTRDGTNIWAYGSWYMFGGDTGWVTLSSLPSDTTCRGYNGGDLDVKYRRIGNEVYIAGELSPKQTYTGSANTRLFAFNMPAGYRPTMEHVSVAQGSAKAIFLWRFAPDGSVNWTRYRNDAGYAEAPNTAWLSIHISYITDDPFPG